ncbi:MAG TPA: hypothetical protein VN931_01040 [Fibrobacteria bacterium]|nr:hypothetical protein [Fibrobacteria bacterium]
MNRQNLSALALASTCLWLSSCDSQKVTGTMDETNASAARLLDTAGTPAAGANLLVFHPLDSTRTPVAAGVTLADGSYSLPTVPDGMYQILARSAGRVAVLDSVYTSQGKLLVRTDTLRDPGSIYGVVEMVGDDNPASVEVSVLGSDLLVANVAADGSYRLDNLGAGTWTLKFSTSLAGYANTYVTVRSSAAKAVDVDTVAMDYVDIPPVSGLRATYDTITGTVHLTWGVPTGVKGIRDVEILRVNSVGTGNPALVGTSDSTGYLDSIYPPPNSDYNQPPFAPTTWLYNVAIRTESSIVGKVAYTTVTTIDPRVIVPTFGLGLVVRDSALLPTDTIGLILNLTGGATSGLQTVSWLAPGLDNSARTPKIKGRSAMDTLLIPLGALDTTKLATPISIAVTDSVGHHFTFQSTMNDSLYLVAKYAAIHGVPPQAGNTLIPTDTITSHSDSTPLVDSTAKDTVVSWRRMMGTHPAVARTRLVPWTEKESLWARLEAIRLRKEDGLG